MEAPPSPWQLAARARAEVFRLSGLAMMASVLVIAETLIHSEQLLYDALGRRRRGKEGSAR